uniref:Uncharacterized protein n=1 Tax=Oryza brachyantha TaxID=4533 RepID=J3MUF4_ORYBR
MARKVAQRPGRRAVATPVWRREEDGTVIGGSPVRVAIVLFWPKPEGVGVAEHPLQVGSDGGGGDGRVGEGMVTTNGASGDSVGSIIEQD